MWCSSASIRNWAYSWLIGQPEYGSHSVSCFGFSDCTRERQMSPMAATKRKIDERAHAYRVICRTAGIPFETSRGRRSLEKAKEALMSAVTELEATLDEPKHADGTGT
jgi:hypothetical protein